MSYFHRMFNHRKWANSLTLNSVVRCPASHVDAMPILAHMLAADRIWLSRLQREVPVLFVWPTLTLEQCQALAGDVDAGWTNYLNQLMDEDFYAEIDYKNSRGEPFSNVTADILAHVITHGFYHRGQLARIVGRAGGEAPTTDFIVYVREAM